MVETCRADGFLPARWEIKCSKMVNGYIVHTYTDGKERIFPNYSKVFHKNGKNYAIPMSKLNKTGHRKVYEQFVGKIPQGEIVHHIDSNRENNNPENLICLSPAYHRRAHSSLRHAISEAIRLGLIYFDSADFTYKVENDGFSPKYHGRLNSRGRPKEVGLGGVDVSGEKLACESHAVEAYKK